MNIISQITNKCFPKKSLNILSSPIHERFQGLFKDLKHQFYLVHVPNGKTWDNTYGPLPKNHILIPQGKELPLEIDIDVVLSQNKFDAANYFLPLAKHFNIPLIQLEHTAPMPQWTPNQLHMMKQIKGDVNVFITDWSRQKWGWSENECEIIYHGIDTDTFRNRPYTLKQDYILSVANMFRERNWCLGFDIWREVVKDLPHKHLGKDPGFSEPAKSINDLVFHYNECGVFVNTATVSPIPMVVLEAMSCGACVVSLASCDVPKFIKHGYNGLLGNNAQELRALCQKALADKELRLTLGQNARKTIVEGYSLLKFTENWDKLLWKTYHENQPIAR